MAGIRRQKQEIADKIAKKKRLKAGTAEYRATVKSLMKLSYPALVNLNK